MEAPLKRRAYLVREVSEITGVKPTTVRKWIDKGVLKAERLGGTLLIPVDQIDTRFPVAKSA